MLIWLTVWEKSLSYGAKPLSGAKTPTTVRQLGRNLRALGETVARGETS